VRDLPQFLEDRDDLKPAAVPNLFEVDQEFCKNGKPTKMITIPEMFFEEMPMELSTDVQVSVPVTKETAEEMMIRDNDEEDASAAKFLLDLFQDF